MTVAGFRTSLLAAHPAAAVALRLAKRSPDWAKALLKLWIGWFWRLPIAGKLAATAAEIVALYLALQRAPLPAATQVEVTQVVAVGLMFLLVAGILFGSARR